MDDRRLATSLRALRARRHWRQEDLARATGVPRTDISFVENGRAGLVRLDRIRALFVALGGWLDVRAATADGELDRTLNAAHAAMHEVVGRMLREVGGWDLAHEVSFSFYGERGVVDILAWHPVTRTLIVIELKTTIVDANELVGSMDRRRRLAARIARERGWDPAIVATWVVVEETRTNRRRFAAHVGLLRAAFPADGRAIRTWLEAPRGPLAALSFLPKARNEGSRRSARTPRRVRMLAPRSRDRI